MAVDLGGSLAVASRGLYATGVSTDLNGKRKSRSARWISNTSELFTKSPFTVTYLNSGGKVGDTLRAIVTCDKCD